MEDWLVVKNPDDEYRKKVLDAIRRNGGYCPSKPHRSPDTKCHCKQYREHGDCECGLFLKFSCIDVTGVG